MDQAQEHLSLSWIMRAPQRPRLRAASPASDAHITWAAITLMTRRLSRSQVAPAPPHQILAALRTAGYTPVCGMVVERTMSRGACAMGRVGRPVSSIRAVSMVTAVVPMSWRGVSMVVRSI